jgi:predicted phosphodiesterase
VYFELSQPHAGVLAFKAVEQPSATTAWVQLDDQVSKHLITLKGLDPGLEYEAFVALLDDEDSYRSPSFSGEMWDPIRFNTPLKDVGLVSVGVIGDTGFGGTTTRILIEEMTNYDLDFVIHTGDVVYNVQDDLGPIDAFMKKFYSPFSPILQRMPVYPVVGNHDVNPATFRQDVPFYFHAFPVFSDANLINRGYENRREWYAFSYGSVQFVMLNSYAFYSGSGRAEQTEWLQERLSDKRFDVSVAVFHIAPYTSGKHEDDGLPIRSEWLPLFKQAGVPLVLSGHDHNYERLEIEGITYIVTGGGSAILYPVQRSLLISRVFAARTHFVLLEFYPDRIELTAIALGGNTLDAEVIRYE